MNYYYESIDDILLFNWWKVREGEIKYCRKDLSKGTRQQDEKAYEKINDSYLAEFGFDAEVTRIIEIRQRIAMLQCDFVIEDNQYYRNEIRRLEKELVEILTRDQNGLSNDVVLIHLEKWMGFRLDEKKITARKFYLIVKEYEKFIESQK
jgi:hypothetical protein